MWIPRFTSDQLLNNVALTGVATTVLILVLVITLVLFGWLVRRAARATGSEKLTALSVKSAKPLRRFGTILSLVLVVTACSALALAVYTRTDLHEWLSLRMTYFTAESGPRLRITLATLAVMFVGFFFVRSVARSITPHLEKRLRAIEALKGQDETIKRLVGHFEPIVVTIALYVMLSTGASWLNLPGGVYWFFSTVFYVTLVVRIARALVLVVLLATETLERLGDTRVSQSRFSVYYHGIRNLWPLARRTFEAVAYLAAATLIVQRFESLVAFAPYGPRIIRLLAIFFVARVVVELSQVLVHESLIGHKDPEVVKRRRTLVYLVQSIVKYTIYFGALLLMMEQIGVDPTPFLAGAGIVGLAVSLGAQKLVNDMVSGFFILFEGQLLTGDFVKIGDAEGFIEAVQLRVTMIRDVGGRLHILRNGDIETIINSSRGFVNATVIVTVPFESDIGPVLEGIKEAGRRLRVARPADLLGDTEVIGLSNFGADIEIITSVKVVPGGSGLVEVVFRRILWETFKDLGLEVADSQKFAITMPNAPLPNQEKESPRSAKGAVTLDGGGAAD